MASSVEKLLSNLAEHAEWCDANEWETPITMGDDIRSAMELIMRLTKETPRDGPFDPWGRWKFSGYDFTTESACVIWTCTKCGYRRLAGWAYPNYNCPECTGRDNGRKEDKTV